jgi:excisionase family DNA binding protein
MSQKLTVKELAERWNVHPQTIYKWARRKRIPGMKFSRSKRGDWRFDLEQIEKWERLNTTGAMN